MLRKNKCKHCVGLFQPIREGHLYCSSTCRKLEFKAKKRVENKKKISKRIANKLEKLSGSSFGRFLVREVRRAGTVQILQGHTASTMTELAVLKRRCTTASGYDNGESLGVYELSHIYPVRGSNTNRIGLLNTKNLTIAPKEFNRRHSTTVPVTGYCGESIDKQDIQSKWDVCTGDDAPKIIALARKFVGEEFDAWLNKHVITSTQKQALVKTLEKAGFSVKKLEGLSLEQLRAMAEDEDVAYFHITQSPSEVHHVLIDELKRMQIEPNFLKAFEWLQDEEWEIFFTPEMVFKGTKSQQIEFKEFLVQQSLASLHGQPYSNKWKKKAVLDWFGKIESNGKSTHEPYRDEDDDITL